MVTALTERLAQFVNGVRQVQDLSVELGDQCVQLVHGVEDFDALSVRVESHLERAGHGWHPAPEFLLGVFEALGHVVNGLVLLVLVWLQGRGCGVEGAQLWLVRDGVQELTVGGQQSSTVRLDFAVFLAQAELHREPVDLDGVTMKKQQRTQINTHILFPSAQQSQPCVNVAANHRVGLFHANQ